MENGHIANETPSFCTQANALLRKNFTYHKRNVKTNVSLIMAPIMFFLLLVCIQRMLDTELNKGERKCGCICTRKQGDTCLKEECGVQYSDLHQVGNCPIPNPPEWPPLLQLPAPQYRAYRTHFFLSSDFANASYPVTILFTGTNQSFGEIISGNMIPSTLNINNSNIMASMATNVMGSESAPHYTNFLEPAFFSDLPIYYLQRQCMQNSTFHVPVQISSISKQQDVKLICAQCLRLWHNSSFEVNNELYKGYWQSNPKRQINEIVSGYDFLNSNGSIFNVSIWYNSTYKNDTGFLTPIALARVPRSINMVSNAYLQFLLGAGTKMLFEFVKEMPKPETKNKFDFASLLGVLFFTWIILQLFPIALISLVYEKQQKLRIMMKMHGLSDVPYWMISYGYFLAVSIAYLLCCVIFGSVIGLKFFTMNDYSIQFVFYFIYINLQISLAFLLAPLFSNAKTATVIAYIGVLESGELASVLFQFFVQDTSFPRGWIIVMELYPVLALYRGLYEFSQYAFNGNALGTDGMRWRDLNDSTNGMKEVLIIMFIEWLLVVFFIYYMNQVLSSGSSKNPLFFLKGFHKNLCPSFRKPGIQRQDSKVFIQIDKPDVNQEREKVKHLLLEREINHAIVCDNMRKVYHGRDGNPDKVAVNGLSLALPQGECLGMLGPNGAGKTSFINMMIGLTKPTSGTTFVQGLDIKTHMDVIYTSMGVCPQQDLLWESLTGREHLLFYGRLKNLKGSTLTQAVEESLRSVNLFHGGVADKQAGKYSGGMKRKLSVAISLIGNPRVVYMDEPSTGLDPASRKNLWNVIKRAKQGRAIILTTHSMEEAEVLCDRLGILVDGSLQCIGNPKELKARYGKTYIFTVTTSMDHEKDVENLVQHISPNANKIYNISGTQKFELPKDEIKIANVFKVIENAKRRFTVSEWSLVDTTLEDVFIKVARRAQANI